MIVPPPIAFRTGLMAWSHYRPAMLFRVELASSSADAPLFLISSGDRIRWTPDHENAATFLSIDAAWDAIVAEQLNDIVRVTR